MYFSYQSISEIEALLIPCVYLFDTYCRYQILTLGLSHLCSYLTTLTVQSSFTLLNKNTQFSASSDPIFGGPQSMLKNCVVSNSTFCRLPGISDRPWLQIVFEVLKQFFISVKVQDILIVKVCCSVIQTYLGGFRTNYSSFHINPKLS